MAPEVIICGDVYDCSTCAERHWCSISEVRGQIQDQDDKGEEKDEDADRVEEEDRDENDKAEGDGGEHQDESDQRRIARPSPPSVTQAA
jgi:hypothetical protein